MRGIDLYKTLLDGETKYEGKEFMYDKNIIHVDNNEIWVTYDYTIFALKSNELRRFFNAELTEIKRPISWQECIKKWSENPKEYCIEIKRDDEYTYIKGATLFDSLNELLINYRDILYGEWRLIEK